VRHANIFLIFHDFWELIFYPREEIAACFEKAYHSLDVTEAARLLMFNSQNDLAQYSQTVSATIL
jgi:hypothetical protein